MRRNDRLHSPLEYTIFQKTIKARDGVYSDYPADLLPEIQTYLHERGISRLYCHQAEMFEQASAGKNIVITTSTASGKTLSFLLPVIQEILKDPSTRAIFLYPTKALASDQMRAIESIIAYFGSSRISAGVYDGDTPPNERQRIRRSANIILTNPDMLNSAFLPNHSGAGFSFIFSNLKYVVIDELHTYRGAFGSHLANVFRRLNRICKYYKSVPQFLCSSATIANPVELAENITDQKFIQISRDGSPAPEKEYVYIQPPAYGDSAVRKAVTSIAKDLIPELVVDGSSFIAFCKSRKAAEVVVRESKEMLDAADPGSLNYADLIASYRGGYKPTERKAIEQKMVAGQLKGLVSTNALELGIDIGKVDTTVLTGFPGTRASFWQQSGRAGRNGKKSKTYLILDNLPMDQYLAVDPEWLFSSNSENAVIDKNNLYIQIAHARAAAAELPLSLDDMTVFPCLGEIVPILMNVHELQMERGRFVWQGSGYPAGDFSLRNIDRERYRLINSKTNEQIEELDELRAFKEIHKGSVYMNQGQLYLVTDFDVSSRNAICEPFDGNYYTMPDVRKNARIIKAQKQKNFYRTTASFGDISVVTAIPGHKKLQFHNHDNLGYEGIDPLHKTIDTEGVWIQVPANVINAFARLNSTGHLSQFDGLVYAILNAAKAVTMTDQSDIDASSMADTDNNVSIVLYDLFVGGMGYSEKCFDLIDVIIQHAIRQVKGCRCKNGCPACVGDYKLDRNWVLWGLENILAESNPPIRIESKEEPEIIQEKKPFSLETLADEWNSFREFIADSGETNSAFLSNSVSGIVLGNKQITFIVDHAISVMMINDENNNMQIKNTLRHYVKMPRDWCFPNGDFVLEARVENDNDPEQSEKIARHYKHLSQE